ncbi:MAG: hypothetical protein ACI9RO_001137 [Alteromonas macleodii]|jgi:hypothetical protein
MLKRFRLTPCFSMDMIKEGHSHFKLCAKDARLRKSKKLSCLVESFAFIASKDPLVHHMRVFNFKLEVGKKYRLGQVGTQPSRNCFPNKMKQIKKAAVLQPKPPIFSIFWKQSRRSRPHFISRITSKLSAPFSHQPIRLTPRYEGPLSAFILAKTASATSA